MEKIRVGSSKTRNSLTKTRGWQRAASQPVDGLCQRELDAAKCDDLLRLHKQDRTRPASSMHGPPRLNSPWNPRCSEISCCVGSACHSCLLQKDAGVANHMMPSEITLPLAHGLVSCARVGAHLRERLPEYAGRRALVSRCKSLCVISIWSLSARTRDA